jgi:hypothetical protein
MKLPFMKIIENSITKDIERELTQTDKILEDIIVLKIDNLQDLDRMVNQGFEVIFMGRKGESAYSRARFLF